MADRYGATLPVTVLTGFLGAGKTTLLRRLLTDPALARAAVVMNELGEIGLDHDLVRVGDETVVELISGCLCCAVIGDLARTLRDLHLRLVLGQMREFDRVVIETTGLADPTPILHTLLTDPMLEHFYRLEGVVTVVDAVNGMRTLDRQPEAVKQIAVADRLVLTKVDIAGPVAAEALGSRLRRLNPAAPILAATAGAGALLDCAPWSAASHGPEVERWLGAVATERHHHGDHSHHPAEGHHDHGAHHHDQAIRAFTLRESRPVPAAALSLFLDLLMDRRGDDLLRVKGIVHVAEAPHQPLVLHAVQHIMHEPFRLDAWPTADRDTRLVMITRNVPEAAVRLLLDALLEEPVPTALPASGGSGWQST